MKPGSMDLLKNMSCLEEKTTNQKMLIVEILFLRQNFGSEFLDDFE